MNHRGKRGTAPRRGLAVFALAVASASSLVTGCAPLVIGGAMVGGAIMAVDRRTTGAQVEDQGIEARARSRVGEVVGSRGHVNVTSYNRMVLLTGEVPSESDKSAVEAAVSKIDNVRAITNELAVMGTTSLVSRSSDTITTSKVKATFVDAKDVSSNIYKVVTERGNVYLLGRVTEREAERAVELTRSVGGVQKVVRLFEVLTEAQAAAAAPQPPLDKGTTTTPPAALSTPAVAPTAAPAAPAATAAAPAVAPAAATATPVPAPSSPPAASAVR